MAASNLNSIRRQVKNVAYNYSDTQVKVREATSNDPWGPSSSLMSEIADLTNNTVAFHEIMQMLWKRLNDKNKNWRHVYKSLVLMDYLVKCGSERVAQQCKENIFAIETLKSFQYIEDNKDQGHNIRQKATQICTLLKDDEKLKNERTRAIMARKRFVQNSMGMGSDGSSTRQRSMHSDLYDEARPTSVAEEEMQMQLALALSKEEADKESEARKSDDVRLQMALKESEHDAPQRQQQAYTVGATSSMAAPTSSSSYQQASAIDDLLSLGPVLSTSQAPAPQPGFISNNDPWAASSMGANNDPWGGTSSAAAGPVASPPKQSVYPSLANNDPWTTGNSNVIHNTSEPMLTQNDPWAPPAQPINGAPTNGALSNWDDISSNIPNGGSKMNDDLLGGLTSMPQPSRADELKAQRTKAQTPETFLGANANLVNFDELLGPKTNQQMRSSSANPFMSSSAAQPVQPQVNPFVAAQGPTPTLNQMKQQNSLALGAEASNMSGETWSSNLPQPLQPSRAAVPAPTNPFL